MLKNIIVTLQKEFTMQPPLSGHSMGDHLDFTVYVT